MAEWPKFKPVPTEDSEPYWEACAREELRMQKCGACGHAANFFCRTTQINVDDLGAVIHVDAGCGGHRLRIRANDLYRNW